MTPEETIRGVIELAGWPEGGQEDAIGEALAALDALVAERDEALRELDFKKKALRNCREAHLAAEARVTVLEAALEARMAAINEIADLLEASGTVIAALAKDDTDE